MRRARKYLKFVINMAFILSLGLNPANLKIFPISLPRLKKKLLPPTFMIHAHVVVVKNIGFAVLKNQFNWIFNAILGPSSSFSHQPFLTKKDRKLRRTSRSSGLPIPIPPATFELMVFQAAPLIENSSPGKEKSRACAFYAARGPLTFPLSGAYHRIPGAAFGFKNFKPLLLLT